MRRTAPNLLADSEALSLQGQLETNLQGFTTAQQWDPQPPPLRPHRSCQRTRQNRQLQANSLVNVPHSMSSQLHPPANLTPLCQDLRQALSALYGEQLTHLILFGSYARQTATADSDIDIAVAMCNRAEASQKASLDSAFQ